MHGYRGKKYAGGIKRKTRVYENPTHAVLQSSGLSRNVGTLENGLFRLPSSSDFLSLDWT
jgi:hypothetical protein